MTITVRSRASYAVEKLIRQGGKKLNPFSSHFDPDSLRATAEEKGLLNDHSALIEFGIEMSGFVQKLNSALQSHSFQAAHPTDRVSRMLVLASAGLWHVEKRARNQLELGKPTAIRSFLDVEETLQYGQVIRSSELIEGVIDSFSYIVIDAFNEIKQSKKFEGYQKISDFDQEDLNEYINFSNCYRTLLELWQNVLYRGLEIKSENLQWFITVPKDRAIRHAVGETRMFRQTAHVIKQFINSTEISQQKILVTIPQSIASDFRFDGQTWTFKSETILSDESTYRKETLARLYSSLHSWVGSLAFEKIDDSGLRCLDLLEIWIALRELTKSFLDWSVQKDDEPPSEPLTLKRELLEKHLAQGLNKNREDISRCLDRLIHDGNLLTELYGHPLLELNPSEITIFIPGLLHADFERVLVRWLARYLGTSGKDLYKNKGKIYEEYVRGKLGGAIARAALKDAWQVEPAAVHFPAKVAQKEREFDLLLSIGRLLLVGEVKCSIHPCDPREVADRENLIDEAIVQVRDQVQWIRQNWTLFRNRVKITLPLQLKDCEILPIVILDGCYGTGFAVDDIPVINCIELCQFITSREWPAGQTEHKFELYRSLDGALTVISDFLRKPPLVQCAVEGTQSRELDFSNPNLSSHIHFRDVILPFSQREDQMRITFENLKTRFEV
ncbi:MAG: hypothetical protein ABF537_05525 [Acetobacter sp.]|uniref:hypothetical protein n=1 Tax=Acetobacter sp. TaxID=440 RepID=UPI0039EA79A8